MSVLRRILFEILSLFISPSTAEMETIPEPCFGGVPLSELNEIATSFSRGLGVEINGGSLLFHYRSNHGRTTRYARLAIGDDGKLFVAFDANYPGQLYHLSVEFANAVNERYTFER